MESRICIGNLKIRQESDGSNVLTGSFPYEAETDFRGITERFAQRAFVVNDEDNIMLLAGHDFDQPLANTRAVSLIGTE